MDMQLGKGPIPKPEISSVAVSGMVMTFQPSSLLNSLRMRLMSVVLPAAGPPVRTMRVICLAMGTALLNNYTGILPCPPSFFNEKARQKRCHFTNSAGGGTVPGLFGRRGHKTTVFQNRPIAGKKTGFGFLRREKAKMCGAKNRQSGEFAPKMAQKKRGRA